MARKTDKITHPPSLDARSGTRAESDRIEERHPSVDTPAPSSITRSTVGRYELIYPIASGGMATVYVARLSGMAGFERLFAIKVIHPHLAGEKPFIEMFLDEARLAARIHHPNVAEIFEVGEDNGLFFMVGELVNGQDLRKIALRASERHVAIPPAAVAAALSDVCQGLDEAHNLTDNDGEPLNLVHRDVSTRNLLISYKGYPKLIDFGVAWARGRLSQTNDGSAKGKIGYMPPEQLAGNPIDRRADIFALGVVLYTLVVGRHPYPYDNEGEQVAKMLKGEIELPSAANPSLDKSLDDIIMKAMALSPSDRFASAEEMGKVLDAYAKKNGDNNPKAYWNRLMHYLFQDEIALQKTRLQAHRKRTPDSPLTVASGKVVHTNGLSPSSEKRITSVLEKAQHKGDRDSSLVRRVLSRATSDSRTLRRMTLGALVVSVAVGVFLIDGVPSKFAGHRNDAAAERPEIANPQQMPTAATLPNRETAGAALERVISAPPAQRVTIELDGLVAESKVYLDDTVIASPMEVLRSDKPLALRVATPGYLDYTGELIPDEDKTVRIQLTKRGHGKRPVESAASTPSKKKELRPQKKPQSKRLNQKSNRGSNLDNWETNPFQ